MQSDFVHEDHYQVMSAQAIVRFWTLVACLMCFLEEQRASADDPELTCGDVRRSIQGDHRLNLLHWLFDQIQAGASLDDITSQLALSSS